MKIAIYSKTPLAAAPWELYKALKKYTLHEVTLINDKNRYKDGRTFPYNLLWSTDNGSAMTALAKADLWHIHNYLPIPLSDYRVDQRVIAQFHSLPRLGNWRELMEFADANYTITQPLQEQEYRLPSLPNIIDPDEYRPATRQKQIKIAFAPTSRTPIGNPNSKGYYEVKRILESVARKRIVDIEWIEGKPYELNLALKRKSHILIDDIVTGNWHRTSLEGACFGCVVLNRVQKVPFLYANTATLEERLLWLIDSPLVLQSFQERMRLWVLQEWHAMDLVKKYVQAYKQTLAIKASR